MTINADLQRRASVMVSREVYLCVSSLVSTLAKISNGRIEDKDLLALTDQAANLTAPVLDYEGAAREAGWRKVAEDAGSERWQLGEGEEADFAVGAIDACYGSDIEPHELEVYEHWAVSEWLADKLEAKGERIDRDFAGMTVWARTTTGQAISIDAVSEQITEETGINFGGA